MYYIICTIVLTVKSRTGVQKNVQNKSDKLNENE